MRVTATPITGVFRLGLDPHVDERGFFARAYCVDELLSAGIDMPSPQINLSRNRLRGTLRGMHFQRPPFAEAKIVRCVRGSIFDVVADLREDSPTFHRWHGFTLDADGGEALYLPEGCAHGFITLEDDCDVLYQMSRPYVPGHAAGFRYDDPAFTISWPAAPIVIGASDLAWPPWSRGGGEPSPKF